MVKNYCLIIMVKIIHINVINSLLINLKKIKYITITKVINFGKQFLNNKTSQKYLYYYVLFFYSEKVYSIKLLELLNYNNIIIRYIILFYKDYSLIINYLFNNDYIKSYFNSSGLITTRPLNIKYKKYKQLNKLIKYYRILYIISCKT